MIPAAPDALIESGGLEYPFGLDGPKDGDLQEVALGIYWVRMPLPFSLDHINLWVLDGGDHWAIVDTGLFSRTCKDYWQRLFDGPLAGKPVGRVIVTHYHPDHIGLAGWLAKKWDVQIETSRGEFQLARLLALDVAEKIPDEARDFYASQGWPCENIRSLSAEGWGGFGRAIHHLPIGYKRLQDGETLRIGARNWQVVTGSGHSPEHVCLFESQAQILISGDQVLPRITSNISLHPNEPQADPLSEWLDSLDKLKKLPADTLVLPAHNTPFRGLHVRLDQLAADHHRKLQDLLEACEEPLTCYGSFKILFRRDIQARDLKMATGEAMAHLRWLEKRNQITSENVNGTRFYRRIR